MFPILALLIALPVAFLVAETFLRDRYGTLLSTASALISLILVLALVYYAFTSGGISLSESYPFLAYLSIPFALRITPIPLMLLVMSSAIIFVAALSSSFNNSGKKKRGFLLTLFQLSATGLFLSENLLLFFIFWDVGLVASFFFISTLGSGNRKTASFKFLIYEIFASSMLLLSIMLLYTSPVHSLDLLTIQSSGSTIPIATQQLIFVSMLLAFLVNMPVFPFHSWMPDAYVESPTTGTMLLSGILSKFGGFGSLLLFTILPISKSMSGYTAVIASVSIFYALFVLIGQKDIKRALAYASMLEMGIVLLGISSMSTAGINGAAYAMLSYGLIMALMFLDVGALFYVFGERDIRVLKGAIMQGRPIAYAFIFGVFAMVGTPLTSVFIGDLLVFLGSFSTFGLYGLVPLASIVILGAYFYYIIEKSIYGAKEHSSAIYGIDVLQKIGLSVLIFFILLFGFAPFIVFNFLK